jgi:hypothetical protein
MSNSKERILNKYKLELKKMVSEDDFVRNLGLDVKNKTMKYSELENYKTIDELIPSKDDFRILLLESEPSVGHWVCLIRKDDTLEFFDSYGKTHKGELRFIPKFINKMLNQPDDYLTKIMKSSKNPIFSTLKLQNENPDVCTCGRHCIARILCGKAGYDLNDYEQLIKKESERREMPSDILVCHWIPI